MKKFFSAVAKTHTLEIKRDGKLFLSLPMEFEVNGVRYAPALAKKGKNLFLDLCRNTYFTFNCRADES